MWIQFEHASGIIRFDSEKYYDISIPVRKRGNVNCYYLDDANFTYFESPEFSGNLSKGGSVNCEKISLYPHASGTHTECALHVLRTDFDMRSAEIPLLMKCTVFTVQPTITGSDKVIDAVAAKGLENKSGNEAILFRTVPNGNDKLHSNYSGTNPVYFDPHFLLDLRKMGFKHLLTDLPSIDKESDEGKLSAHKNWFLTDGVADARYTITELVYADNSIPDGDYVLNIQAPSIETDAVPSRIRIYPCA